MNEGSEDGGVNFEMISEIVAMQDAIFSGTT